MLELYQHEACEDSKIVRRRLAEMGVSYVIHNPRKPSSLGGDILNEYRYNEMVSIGDKDMFPILIDDQGNRVIHGEDLILDHLDNVSG